MEISCCHPRAVAPDSLQLTYTLLYVYRRWLVEHGCQGTPLCSRWLALWCSLSCTLRLSSMGPPRTDRKTDRQTERHPGGTLMMSATRDPSQCSVDVYEICIIPYFAAQRDGSLAMMPVNDYLSEFKLCQRSCFVKWYQSDDDLSFSVRTGLKMLWCGVLFKVDSQLGPWCLWPLWQATWGENGSLTCRG